MAANNTNYPLKYRHVNVSRDYDSRFPEYEGSTNTNLMINFAGGVASSTGSTNPDYKAKIALLSDATTGYFRKGGSARPMFVSGNSRLVSKFPPYVVHGSTMQMYLGDCPTDFPSTDAVLVDQALASLKRKMRENVGDYNIVVPAAQLGELRGTIRGVTNAATDLVKTLIDIKRTRGRSAIKYASEAWLTFNFGVAPLLSDVRDIAGSIDKHLNRSNRTVRLTGSAQKTWTSETKFGPTTGAIGAVYDGTTAMTHKLSYMYIAGLNITVNAGNNYDALSHFHLEAGALIPSAWELVPFSWVVDYFGTVGDFLEDVFTSPPASTRYVVLCRRYTCDAQVSAAFRAPTPPWEHQGHITSGHWNYFEFERSSLTGVPTRALRRKTLDEVGLNSISKLLNLASILGSK